MPRLIIFLFGIKDTTMSISERLQADQKEAMRSGDKQRLGVIRMARAALQSAQQEAAKQRYDEAARAIEERLGNDQEALQAALAAIEVDPRMPLDEATQESVIAKEIKRRRDAA